MMTELVEKLRKVAGKLSVLIVEDEELIRSQLEHYFERFFSSVTIAVDGEDGLRKFRESGPFDIVISDIRMPNLDGVEMMRIIKEAHPDQKFIIASAHSDSSYFLDLIEMGVFHYIIKPINYTQLMEVLLRLCGQLQLEEELFQYKYNLEELVTEQTRELREQFWTDPTTGLPNRLKLIEDLKRRQGESVAVFNVDNFSKYNATFGTQFGDEVLQHVAKSLGAMMCEGMHLYRYASDEFVVCGAGMDQTMMHERVLKIVKEYTKTPLTLSQCQIYITFTIGIAPCEGMQSVEHARNAVEAVRKVGKGRIVFYDEAVDYESQKRDLIHWIDEVAVALKENRFIPYFQPIIANHDRKIVKYECLARLQLEDGRMASPGEFLPAVEESGFLPEMTRQIIEKSFAVMASNSYDFSVNITSHELQEKDFVEFVAARLKHYGIAPKRLVIEVLEGISLQHGDVMIERLNTLKELGCGLSIDDFGTEGSNFSRLMELNVDYIKIDGIFIKKLDVDEKSRMITRAIVAFAKSIGCKTVAEFVHNEAVWHEVQGMGVDYSQGYWIGAPSGELVDE
jgi:diguanylate cyclase (GGDEF)-like protein